MKIAIIIITIIIIIIIMMIIIIITIIIITIIITIPGTNTAQPLQARLPFILFQWIYYSDNCSRENRFSVT